ncbi:hypothetical protein JW721_02770 [Candidatus Micrarchaeota archaeon]|nr:hypothetical protein [Candidatus Micrarchaeota archaeon]
MGTRKAFVFSLDSFVAFILSVAALYSLLFFATVPSAYYSSLMQANYLAKDTMLALATSQAGNVGESLYGCDPGASMLSCILSDLEADSWEMGGDANEGAARDLIGVSDGNEIRSALIPVQFGYKIETLEYAETDGGEIDFENAAWVEMYDTANDPLSANKKEYHKLKAATHILYFAYEHEPEAGEGSPFRYVSCGGEHSICEWPGGFEYSEDYAGVAQQDIRGDAVAYVVRLTVYI